MASRTAKKIARFVLLIDAIPRLRAILPEGAGAVVEQILRRSGAFGRREIDMMRQPWTRRLYERVERWFGGRGQLLWFGLRKRFIADQVEAALDDGAQQLLVVGAGFDPLATLIASRYPDVLCVEIDAPDTAGPKRTGIESADLAQPNLHVLPIDLSDRPLAEVLEMVPWRTDARSIVVAEGLLMYLPRKAVEGFFAALARQIGRGSVVVFTAVDADDDGRPRVGVLDRPIRLALRLVGEPMRWGIRPSDLPGFLAPLGFTVRAQPSTEVLRERILVPLGLSHEPIAAYEHIAVAHASARVSLLDAPA